MQISSFDQLTRGSFVAMDGACASGYRWDDALSIVLFGQMALAKKRELGDESTLAMLDSPHASFIGRDDGFRDPMVRLEGPWLVALHGEDASWTGQESLYEGMSVLTPPRQEPTGHRRFAGLKTQRAIRLFANRYGLLGYGYTCIGRRNDEPTPIPLRGSTGWLHGEHLAHWVFEIALMAHCVTLLDAHNEERHDRLRNIVEWSSDRRRVTLTFHPFMGLRSHKVMRFSKDLDPDDPMLYRLPEEWLAGDLLAPARYILTETINFRLNNHVHPCLYPDSRGLYFKTDSLLSGLYVSLALEVLGKGGQRAVCKREGCGNSFTIEHGSQKYCSDQCNKRAYEQRKRDKLSITV